MLEIYNEEIRDLLMKKRDESRKHQVWLVGRRCATNTYVACTRMVAATSIYQLIRRARLLQLNMTTR